MYRDKHPGTATLHMATNETQTYEINDAYILRNPNLDPIKHGCIIAKHVNAILDLCNRTDMMHWSIGKPSPKAIAVMTYVNDLFHKPVGRNAVLSFGDLNELYNSYRKDEKAGHIPCGSTIGLLAISAMTFAADVASHQADPQGVYAYKCVITEQ